MIAPSFTRRMQWESGVVASFIFLLSSAISVHGQHTAALPSHFYIDCSATATGDGSREHPWNSLAAAESHVFAPGDLIAMARGSVCHGTFAPHGSGAEGKTIRLTSFGPGPRPRIVAPSTARQALLLLNQEYWQIDSLDIFGGSTYGIFVTADEGPAHHIFLKNIYVHDVYGGTFKNKDNGLVVVGPSGPAAVFNDVLIDGVDAAHTNQWSGIMVGGGNFAWPENAPLNRNIIIRNSTAQDVFGDGIILFRDQDSAIRTSAAWHTGMQPTQDVGTPNAIWTWRCTDCVVADNEAFLTDSPGVDGGAYDIDWDNVRNIVERNYAHDTQGYCVAVFAAGYVTRDSIVRDNLCIDNALSPRLAALQGAVYLHTWNDGVIHGLRIEHNTIEWHARAARAPAIINDASLDSAAVFSNNRIASNTPLIYRTNTRWAPSMNTYSTVDAPVFTLGEQREVPLAVLQSAGFEKGSIAEPVSLATDPTSLRLDATIQLAVDDDGLLNPEARAQLIVLRSLAGQYGQNRLAVSVHLISNVAHEIEINVLRDLEDIYPGALHFDHDSSTNHVAGSMRLQTVAGQTLKEWHGFQNAAELGAAVRAHIGAPDYTRAP